MKSVIIRKVNKADINKIVKALRKAYLPIFKSQKLSKTTIDEQFRLNDASHLLLRIKDNYFFVAEDGKNKKIIGLIGLRKDDNSKIHNRISTFFVLQEYQGKGVGSMLFNKVMELVKKFKVKKLVVNSSFFAEDIYKHWGFKRIKITTKKYPNGDVYKNVWMEKEIFTT